MNKLKLFVLGITGAALVTAGLYACSNDEANNPQQENIEQTSNLQSKSEGEINMSSKSFTPFTTDTIVLFEAANVEELNAHIDGTFKEFNNELEAIRVEFPNVDLVTYNLTFKNNKAIITDLYFLDTAAEVVVDVFENGTNSVPSTFWEGVAEVLLGKCPNGWTSKGAYSSEEGLSEATKQVLAPNLDSNGDCIQLQYARGLLSVQLCYRTC